MRGVVRPTKTRVILPLNAVMQIFDAILAVCLDDIISDMFPSGERPGLCYHGATEKRTQPMDIAHAVQMLVQKGMDSESKMTVAQQDIAAYYDSIDIKICADRLVNKHGTQNCAAVAKALLAMHSMTMVEIQVSEGTHAKLPRRTSGVLTGTRTAGRLGRLPWLEVCRDRYHVWKEWSLDIAYQPTNQEILQGVQKREAKHLGICTWIDNFFCLSETEGGAIAIAEDTENYLREKWGLNMGADSKKYMRAKFCKEPRVSREGWRVCVFRSWDIKLQMTMVQTNASLALKCRYGRLRELI